MKVKKTVVFVCLMIASCLVLSAQMKTGPGMCEKKAQVLLDKVLEMWNKPDLALIPELYTADCLAQTSSYPEPFLGHEGIKKWVEMTRAMFPDMKMAFKETVLQGNKAATMWTLTGTQTSPMQTPIGALPATGKKVRITGLAIDCMKDGKFEKEIVIYNVLDMMMQMGFTLNPPVPALQ
jgi:steroid delta-isomerase-like uncharacterized protein